MPLLQPSLYIFILNDHQYSLYTMYCVCFKGFRTPSPSCTAECR